MIRAARGGSPALHERREEGRGYAPKRAQQGAWVLMARGCKPQTKGNKCQPFTAGHRLRKGWTPQGRDYRLGSARKDLANKASDGVSAPSGGMYHNHVQRLMARCGIEDRPDRLALAVLMDFQEE